MEKHTKDRVAEAYPKWLLLLSLVISNFATQPLGLISGLLLIEIGFTFGQQVVMSGQIRTMSSVVGAVLSLLLGSFSVRFSPRSLLLRGLLLLTFSSVGCSIASNFTSMLVFYSRARLVESSCVCER